MHPPGNYKKEENKSISWKRWRGVGRAASAAIRTSSTTVGSLVVYKRTVILELSKDAAHSCVHVQVARTKPAHLAASTFLSIWRCYQYVQQTGTQRTKWQDRRQYSTTAEIQVEEWDFVQKPTAATAVFKISGNKECACNAGFCFFCRPKHQVTSSALGCKGCFLLVSPHIVLSHCCSPLVLMI